MASVRAKGSPDCKPGKALHIGIALWFYAGLTNSPRVALNLSSLLNMGITRDSARRGLHALENEKLVSVIRHPGRKPVVTILFQESASLKGENGENGR